ncbi:hypothetical protein SERLA73DRAFT_152660 [Serpula lacrymans var. lacrymans S7.3]|uniref:Uncharacterized protein n=1 Tax=Serpula lacrymans var. lacrymans (strain S7.3) TaxID=936435 RepID=F8PYA7_SERL3|nr:hypothetical protein SERLA73DRAFT_152660 [Serpula lacrymans var. lacrymans S7.3]
MPKRGKYRMEKQRIAAAYWAGLQIRGIILWGIVPALRIPWGEIPLKLTVTLPNEWTGLTPIFQMSPIKFLFSRRDMHTGAGASSNRDNINRPIPFLPLQLSFDPGSSQCWINLVAGVQTWLLVDVVYRCCHAWIWGQEAFWMAFVAAYPDFPAGDWSGWSSKILLEDLFLNSWMAEMNNKNPQHSVEGVAYSKQIAHVAARAIISQDFQDLLILSCQHRIF